MKIFKNILNFIFPTKCYVCQNTYTSGILCASCFTELQVKQHTCHVCGVDLPQHSTTCALCLHKYRPFNSLNFYYIYNKTTFSLISQFKYFHKLAIQDFLVQTLVKSIPKEILQNIDVVIPVPMYYFKLLRRRYNHSAVLAKAFANSNNLYFNPLILKKHQATKAQMTLSGSNRLSNVKNSFNINPKYIEYLQGKRVLLIDDVITTGATIHACAKVLKKAKVREVHILAIARVQGILKI
ncbi:Amidophosphoribosyltransferase [Candidatus Hepatincola sp. Av]